MHANAEEPLFTRPETFFDQLLNWSLSIAAVFQIVCLICVGFAASGSRIKGGGTTVRPLNCRCRSRSTTRLSPSATGTSEEATGASSTLTGVREQRRTGSGSQTHARNGRHHRRRNR